MPSSDRRALLIVIGVFATAYSLYGLFRHWQFNSSAFDLGIFDQAIWHLSRLEPPASTISGFSNILGDHFYPVIALFVPFYWLWPRPDTLIIVQAILLAASALPVFLFARTRLPRAAALALTVAYCLFWGIQRAMAFDVHEMAFAPLSIAWTIYALDRRNWTLFWIAAGSLLLIKEDLVPFLTAVGVYLALDGEWRRGVVLVVASLVAFAVIVGVLIPAFSDDGGYAHAWLYSGLLREPWRIPAVLVTPPQKLVTAFMWVAPFLFMPLWSPLLILAAPLAVERLLSSSPTHWTTIFHYSAPLAPILAMSAADGMSRLASRLEASPPSRTAQRFVIGVAAVSVVLCAILPGRLPLWRLFRVEHYVTRQSDRDGRTAVAMIPADASVAAQASIVPHLSQRQTIYMLEPGVPDTDYVIAAEPLSPWPLPSFDAIRGMLDERAARGYTVLHQANGWTVLQSPDSAKGGIGSSR